MRLDDLVVAARSRFRISGDCGEAIGGLLNKLKPEDYTHLHRRLSDTPEFLECLVSNPIPRSYSEISRGTNIFPQLAAAQLLAWMSATLKPHAPTLNSFIALERRIDEAANGKDWASALKIVHQLEDQFGKSIWSLNRKLVLLERDQGVAAQKIFANSILENESVSARVRFLTAFFSAQAESAVSAESYYDEVARVLKEGIKTHSVYRWIAFHAAFFGPFDFLDLDGLLEIEVASSIIDRYISFVRMGQMIYADSRMSHYARGYRIALKLLGSGVLDVRLSWLRAVFGVSAAELWRLVSKDTVDIYDRYTTGNYASAAKLAGEFVASGKVAVEDLMELEAIASARAGINVPPTESDLGTNLLMPILAGLDSTSEAIAKVRKEISCFSQSRRAAILHAVIERQTSAFSKVVPVRFERLADVSGLASNPRALFHAGVASKLMRGSLPTFVLTSPTYMLYRETSRGSPAVPQSLDSIPATRVAKYRAQEAYRRNNDQKALEFFETLHVLGDALDLLDAAEGKTATYLRMGRIPEACETLSNYVLSKPSGNRRFPVEQLCQAIEDNQKSLPREGLSIEIPNVFGIYSTYHRKDREYRMGTVCEDFLISRKLARPTGLKQITSSINPTQLIFFLSNVCVIPVIDNHPVYSDLQDVEEERVAILQWLLELNPSRRPIYAGEIAEITRRQKLRLAMQSVEKSKVTVNMAGVKSIVPPDAQELYKRFRTLPKFGRAQLEELVRQVSLRDRLARQQDGTLVVVLGSSERAQALTRLYELIRQRFLFSNDFGLDAYLSVGIRHIVMPGQLRACFERNDLITSKDSSGKYATNEVWSTHVPVSVHSRLQLALAVFSERVDTLIGYLRNDVVQIQTEKKPNGLLRITLESKETDRLDAQLSSAATFEEAVDHIIALLWSQTDEALKALRSYLRSDFRDSVDRAIDELETSIRALTNRVQSLEAAVTTARTQFHDEVEAVAKWFVRSDTEPLEDFDFNLAYDMALATVSRCYVKKHLDIEFSFAGEDGLRSTSLNPLVNILVVLLDNALNHGEEKDGSVSLRLEVSLDRPRLSIQTQNRIGRTKDIQGVTEQLGRIRETISAWSSLERVRAEGGTGLVKIARIAKSDLRIAPILEFSVSDDRVFHASIELLEENLWA